MFKLHFAETQGASLSTTDEESYIILSRRNNYYELFIYQKITNTGGHPE